MKRLVKLILIVSLLPVGYTACGQSTIKLGHINSQDLFMAMPESDSAQKKLEAIAKQFEETLEQLQVEFNKKYDEFTKLTKDPAVGELILRTKEEELGTLQQRIQSFQQEAQNEISRKRTELFKPVQDKALKAVNDVARENGFTYIFDMAVGTVVFAADNTIDILPLVKKKLGLE
ncbi:MAG: OmpH family outer membrane protein [Bacteroidales bacterium]|nr:OmpH family outer membrane protein [Bacteroidales bacterium]